MAAVIEAFETTGTGLRLKDLQTVTGLSKSTLSETIDELVKNELLIRQPSRTDRRAIEILPTKKGIRSMKVTSQKLDDLWENITADIPENDRAVFHNVLMQVSQTLKCQ